MVWPAAARRRWAIPGLAQPADAPASASSRAPAPPRHTGRVRVPPPLISRRLPSGRGATEQPNVTGDGDAALSPRFWAMLALTGVAAGLFGDLMMLISVHRAAPGLRLSQRHAGGRRRARVRTCAGSPCCSSPGRSAGSAGTCCAATPRARSPSSTTWSGAAGAHLSFRRSLGTSVMSELVIGMGASIGRENAPKLMGGASASVLAGWAGLSPAQRRLLMACGGGAGPGRGLQRPAGRGAVHRRGHAGQRHRAGGAARAGLLGHRHGGCAGCTCPPGPPTWTSPATASPCRCWPGRCWPAR